MIVATTAVLAALSSPSVPPPPPAAANTAPTHSLDPQRLHARRVRQRRVYRAFSGSFLLAGLGLHAGGLIDLYAADGHTRALGLMVSGTSLNAAGLVMTGWASRAHGQVHALEGVAAPRWRRRRALGWSLVGVGLGVYAASRIAPAACFTTECAASVTVGGYLAGFAMTLAGVHIIGYSAGYGDDGRSVRVSPAASTTGRTSQLGLTLSGSF